MAGATNMIVAIFILTILYQPRAPDVESGTYGYSEEGRPKPETLYGFKGLHECYQEGTRQTKESHQAGQTFEKVFACINAENGQRNPAEPNCVIAWSDIHKGLVMSCQVWAGTGP